MSARCKSGSLKQRNIAQSPKETVESEEKGAKILKPNYCFLIKKKKKQKRSGCRSKDR